MSPPELPTPLQTAATVVLVADRPELEVLVLERRAGSVFVPGMTVFPGGAVDAHDGDPRWERHGLSDDAASDRLGMSTGGLSYWVAAIRETWEEAALFLGNPAPTEAERRAVDSGEVAFHDVIDRHGATIDVARLHPVARWITPYGSPRRYDTYFFVAEAGSDAEVTADGTEAISAHWLRPDDAIREVSDGARNMLGPTYRMLETLATYRQASEVIAAAVAAETLSRVASVRRLGSLDTTRYALPADPEFAASDAVTSLGWQVLPNAT